MHRIISDSQKWMLLAGGVIFVWLLIRLAPILTPFAISALFAYLGDPLADRLEKWKHFNRSRAVIVVFTLMSLLIALLLLILIPLLENQVTRLVQRMPEYISWVRDVAVPGVQSFIGVEEGSFLDFSAVVELVRQNWTEAGGIATAVLSYATSSGAALLGWIANLVLIPVLTFYFLRDWDPMLASIQELLPRHWEKTVGKLASEADERLSAFIRGQLGVMLALGAIYSIGLWIVGIDLAFLIGMGAGLLSFIPYLGSILGLAVALIAAVVQYQDVLHPVLVLVVFGVGQSLEGMVLTPWLVGDRIGLHPVAVIFAVLAGGQLFGFFGVLLALPVAAVLMVLIRHGYEWYRESRLYDRDPIKFEEI